MSATNAMGWAIIDWSSPHAIAIFVIFTLLIAIGYVVIWFYWQGRNWARLLVLLTSLLTIWNLRGLPRASRIERVMIVAEALLGIFLLIWLNTRDVRAFFRDRGSRQQRS